MPVIRWNGEPIRKAAVAAAKKASAKLSADIVREAKRRAPSGVSGNLRRSIDFSVPKETEGGGVTTQIGFAVGTPEGSVYYGVVMEMGRKPGKKPPPKEALVLWVMRVLKPKLDRETSSKIRQKARANKRSWFAKTGGKVLSAAGAISARQAKLAEGIAFVIARSIGEKGIKARAFLRPAADRLMPWLPAIMRDFYHAELAKLPKSK